MTENIHKSEIKSRPVRGEDDFWLVRNFLIETYSTTPPEFNWEIRRWDGSYFHNEKPGFDARWERDGELLIRLWETGEGKLVGAAHTEGNRGDAYLQIHPDYRDIEEEMIEWCEEKLFIPDDESDKRKVFFMVYDYNVTRQRILEKRGYEKLDRWEVVRRIRFGNKHIPRPNIADGYIMRTTNPDDEREGQRVADLLNAAFNRTIHKGQELMTFWKNSPSYRNDLELFAEAPDGTLVAYVGMIYDEVNRFGLFEPVCTHPDHRGRGLASVLMYEGMHRLKESGAIEVYVGTGEMDPANRLYESVGFTDEVYKGYFWKRIF